MIEVSNGQMDCPAFLHSDIYRVLLLNRNNRHETMHLTSNTIKLFRRKNNMQFIRNGRIL